MHKSALNRDPDNNIVLDHNAAVTVAGQSDPRLYFIVVFWGEQYLRYFVDILVSSLLAPGNIPGLKNLDQCKFLVCTTAREWAALQAEPQFKKLEGLLDVVFVEMTAPAPEDSKMLVMSRGHKILSHMAYEDNAVGVFLTPDLMLSKGSLVHVQDRVREGYAVVLVAALRFSYEGCIPEMVSRGFLRRNAPLEMSGREMMDIALSHLHTETRRYEWDAPYFARDPIAAYWQVPDGSGILLHSFSWAPLAVNYATIKQHDSTTFDRWTLDGNYIHANFGEDQSQVYVVTDSDEISLVSFTKEAELNFPLDGDNWPKQSFWRNQQKLSRLRRLASSDIMDPLKRRILPEAVAWHRAPIDEAVWTPVRERAGEKIETALSPRIAQSSYFGVLDYIWDIWTRGDSLFVSMLHEFYASLVRAYFLTPNSIRSMLRPVLKWRNVLRLRILPAPQAVDGLFYNNLGVGTTKSKWIAPEILTGKMYWEVHAANIGTLPDGRTLGQTATVGVMTEQHFELDGLGEGAHAWGWRCDGNKVHRGQVTSWGQSPTETSQVVMVALDADSGQLWFGQDGHWMEAGDPANGTGEAFRLTEPGGVYPALSSAQQRGPKAMMEARVHRDTTKFSPPVGFCNLTVGEEHLYSIVSWKHFPLVASVRLYSKSGGNLKAFLKKLFKLRRWLTLKLSVYDRKEVLDGPLFNQLGIGTAKTMSIAPRLSSGRWYWEVHSPNIGPLEDGRNLGRTATVGIVTDRHFELEEIGVDSGAWGWRGDGRKVHDGQEAPWGLAASGASQVVMIAFDADSGQVWFGQDGDWMEGGDPTEGTGEAFRICANEPLYPAVSSFHQREGAALLQTRLHDDSIEFPPPNGYRVPSVDD